MRILQVTPRYPPQTGGVETHVARLSESLVARGHRVTVVTADAGESGDRRERRRGVLVRRTSGVAPDGAFYVAPRILHLVARTDADVVHAHNYHALPMLFAALGCGDRPFVATPHYHGTSADALRDRLLDVYRLPGGWALDRADRIIAVSKWERDLLRDDFGLGPRVEVVPNGVDVQRFSDVEPVVRDDPYLLCVGRLVEYKGVQYLVHALSRLPEYDLVVAGDGPYREHLVDAAKGAGVADRVSFAGYVPDDELASLYAGATVSVLLSSFEAYGLAVAESLAAGTPCVVHEATALTDWTSRDDCVGVRLDPACGPTADANVEAVVDAVRTAVGRAAPSEPLATWDDVTGRVEQIYCRL